MSTFGVLVATLAATVVMMLLVWLLSLAKRDVSIVDVFWGLGFVLIAHIACLAGRGYSGRKLLVTSLVTLWGVRLAVYLLWRNWGQEEDYRYRAMRKHHGERFAWVSLYTVFGLQGALMWVISLPLQVAQASAVPARLTWLDGLATLLWAGGLLFEAVGDRQLARFKANPANHGKVMNRGLWAYTRHPNYFGDAVVWWAFFLIALATPLGVWTLISPLLMTFMLMRVSGVALLERKLVKTRPEYEAYRRETNAFFPWFPRRVDSFTSTGPRA
jgi:steroid 5-alpha reductase family enzyme